MGLKTEPPLEDSLSSYNGRKTLHEGLSGVLSPANKRKHTLNRVAPMGKKIDKSGGVDRGSFDSTAGRMRPKNEPQNLTGDKGAASLHQASPRGQPPEKNREWVYRWVKKKSGNNSIKAKGKKQVQKLAAWVKGG